MSALAETEPEVVAEAEDEEKVTEEESTATFEPLVHLAEVNSKSGEEDETTIFTSRCKLFVYGETLLDAGTGIKAWRERGIGEAKFLKHREFGKIRLLMRQEKTMKVIVNMVIDPRITITANAGSDRSWVWSCFDFSDGELVETVFAMRFGDSDKADAFKDCFEKSKEEMRVELAGEDAEDTSAGDEAADLLSGVTVTEEPKVEDEAAAVAEAEAAPAPAVVEEEAA